MRYRQKYRQFVRLTDLWGTSGVGSYGYRIYSPQLTGLLTAAFSVLTAGHFGLGCKHRCLLVQRAPFTSACFSAPSHFLYAPIDSSRISAVVRLVFFVFSTDRQIRYCSGPIYFLSTLEDTRAKLPPLRQCQDVWPDRAVLDELPRSTNVRAATMY